MQVIFSIRSPPNFPYNLENIIFREISWIFNPESHIFIADRVFAKRFKFDNFPFFKLI